MIDPAYEHLGESHHSYASFTPELAKPPPSNCSFVFTEFGEDE